MHTFFNTHLYTHMHTRKHTFEGISHGVIPKVLDCSLEVNELELQSHYYVHLKITTVGKGGIIAVLLQR